MSHPTSRIILPATEAIPRHSEASAVQLRNGDLLLAWSKFVGRGDNAKGHIAGMSSSDGGHTWHDERVLVENSAGLNVMSPALARLADGGLGLVYSHRESTTEAHRVFRRSDDEGATWSDPVRMTHDGYKTGCHDRLTVLASGRLLAPLHCTDDWHKHHLHVRVAWSDDHGQRWQLGHPIELPKVTDSGESGCIEPGIVQRADGSLLMVIRTAMGTIFRAESHDEGQTWTGLRSMEVVAPVAPALITRLPHADDLLLIWNWHYDWREPLAGTRRPLACAISHDGGDTWPWAKRKLLEADPALTYAYPSCLFVGDVAFVTYFVTPAEDAPGAALLTAPSQSRSLKTMHIPLDWFYR